MPNGSDRITSHPLQQLETSKKSVVDADPEIKSWLALGIKTKKKGGGKKKKGKKSDNLVEEGEPMEEETTNGADASAQE